jgi:hypothetical protein
LCAAGSIDCVIRQKTDPTPSIQMYSLTLREHVS